MSGHNKWSKIKHKKAASDSKKSQVFGKLAKLIATESKNADGNVESPSLKAAIEKAKKENMPNDNIERAVKKGQSGDAATLEPVVFETYGPAGIAIVITGLTDNNNRTSSEIKHLLSKNGLELATPGAAAWAFEKQNGEWVAQTTMEISEDDRAKLDQLIETLEEHEDVQDVYTNAA
ncbi:MAG: YebC/PmpR family DNA-binding transcriptional regulator [Candidatus Paceibacterota bacterium]